MVGEVKEYFFKLIENITNRTMHDIASPLTAIINSNAILSSRNHDHSVKVAYSFPSSQLFQIMEDATQQLIYKINTAKYLYGIGHEKFAIQSTQFASDWEKILGNKIQVIIYSKNVSMHASEAQLISHLIFAFKDNLKNNKEIVIEIGNGHFDIKFEVSDKKDFENVFNKIIADSNDEINIANINQHFFRSLIVANKIKLNKDKNKVIVKFMEFSGQCV